MKNTIKAVGLGAAIAFAALSMTGCDDSKPDASEVGSPSAQASNVSTTSPSAVPSDGATPSGGGGTTGAGGAVKVPMTSTIAGGLKDAYLMKMMAQYPKESTDKVDGPKDARLGKTGGVYYALADISLTDQPMTSQDGPHVWRSADGTDWEYLGDTGGNPCPKVPKSLIKVWGVTCN